MLRAFSSSIDRMRRHMHDLSERLRPFIKMTGGWRVNYYRATRMLAEIDRLRVPLGRKVRGLIRTLELHDSEKMKEDTKELLQKVERECVQWTHSNVLLEKIASAGSIQQGRERVAEAIRGMFSRC